MGAGSVVSPRIGWPSGTGCSRPTCAGTDAPSYDPPWNLATHVDDVLDTVEAAGVERAAWVGHSFGARLVLELCARAPERVERAVLLDPAIQLLPHVGRDFAEASAKDQSFATGRGGRRRAVDDGDLDAARVRRGGRARAPRAGRRRRVALAVFARRGRHRLQRALHRPAAAVRPSGPVPPRARGRVRPRPGRPARRLRGSGWATASRSSAFRVGTSSTGTRTRRPPTRSRSS